MIVATPSRPDLILEVLTLAEFESASATCRGRPHMIELVIGIVILGVALISSRR